MGDGGRTTMQRWRSSVENNILKPNFLKHPISMMIIIIIIIIITSIISIIITLNARGAEPAGQSGVHKGGFGNGSMI